MFEFLQMKKFQRFKQQGLEIMGRSVCMCQCQLQMAWSLVVVVSMEMYWQWQRILKLRWR